MGGGVVTADCAVGVGGGGGAAAVVGALGVGAAAAAAVTASTGMANSGAGAADWRAADAVTLGTVAEAVAGGVAGGGWGVACVLGRAACSCGSCVLPLRAPDPDLLLFRLLFTVSSTVSCVCVCVVFKWACVVGVEHRTHRHTHAME